MSNARDSEKYHILANQMSFWNVFNRLIFITLWIGGLLFIWQLVPVGGRDGWQIPSDEFTIGFLSNGSTIATVPRSQTGDRFTGTKESGPIRLWNIYTGQLEAEHFDKGYVFERAMIDGSDWLRIQEEIEGKPGEYRLRLFNAKQLLKLLLIIAECLRRTSGGCCPLMVNTPSSIRLRMKSLILNCMTM